jgi:hypothetical protein
MDHLPTGLQHVEVADNTSRLSACSQPSKYSLLSAEDKHLYRKAFLVWSLFTVAGWVSITEEYLPVFSHCVGFGFFLTITTHQTRWLAPVALFGLLFVSIISSAIPDEWVFYSTTAIGYGTMGVFLLSVFACCATTTDAQRKHYARKLEQYATDTYNSMPSSSPIKDVVTDATSSCPLPGQVTGGLKALADKPSLSMSRKKKYDGKNLPPSQSTMPYIPAYLPTGAMPTAVLTEAVNGLLWAKDEELLRLEGELERVHEELTALKASSQHPAHTDTHVIIDTTSPSSSSLPSSSPSPTSSLSSSSRSSSTSPPIAPLPVVCLHTHSSQLECDSHVQKERALRRELDHEREKASRSASQVLSLAQTVQTERKQREDVQKRLKQEKNDATLVARKCKAEVEQMRVLKKKLEQTIGQMVRGTEALKAKQKLELEEERRKCKEAQQAHKRTQQQQYTHAHTHTPRVAAKGGKGGGTSDNGWRSRANSSQGRSVHSSSNNNKSPGLSRKQPNSLSQTHTHTPPSSYSSFAASSSKPTLTRSSSSSVHKQAVAASVTSLLPASANRTPLIASPPAQQQQFMQRMTHTPPHGVSAQANSASGVFHSQLMFDPSTPIPMQQRRSTHTHAHTHAQTSSSSRSSEQEVAKTSNSPLGQLFFSSAEDSYRHLWN